MEIIHRLFSRITIYLIIGGILLIGTACNLVGEEQATYELIVNVSPAEGGSVGPEGGIYEEGQEIEIEAIPAEDWQFVEWTGSVSSTENPLSFSISENSELTAHFNEKPKAYSQMLTVRDGANEVVMEFGMEQDASEGFDQGLDSEAPPTPPEGSFYAYFTTSDYNLFTDYRPVSNEQTIWELSFSSEEGRSITLEWSADADRFTGSLTITDDPEDPGIEIDMTSESNYQPGSSVETLYIVQKL